MYRTLTHVLFSMLLIIASMHTAKAQCPAATPLVINSVKATESRCEATGSATVLASGGSTPYTYSIIAGPALTLPQSSNVLQSLAPGSYTVQVTDNCNTSVTSNFTVTGSYTIPVPTITTQSPSCPNSSDGSLTINVTNNRAPYTYSLISPSPVTVGPQAGNVFTGLPAGTYTCQVRDSCGNFQTQVATISGGNAGSLSISGGWEYAACDSFDFPIFIDVSNGFRPPYTTTLTLPNGAVLSHVVNTINLPPSFIIDTYHFRYHHIPGNTNEVFKATVTNNCGASQSLFDGMGSSFDMHVNVTAPTTCSGSAVYTFDNGQDNNGSGSTTHCGHITYTLVSPSGNILATQTNNSTFTGYPPGPGYKVIRQDCCTKDSLQFDWAAPPAYKINGYSPFIYSACREGTSGMVVNVPVRSTNYIILASGPSSVTFMDGTVHTYTYPDTVHMLNIGGMVSITGLAAGAYKIYAVDACGNKDSITATLSPSDMRHSTFTASAIKGCVGASGIRLNAVSNSSFNSSGVADASITINSTKFTDVNNSSFTGTDGNLSSGTYYVSYNYQNQSAGLVIYPTGMAGCDVITDTIVIPAYTQPAFNPAAAVALCGATRQVALLPDSTRGVMPFQYQIINGPTTTSPQASPVFTGLARGTYTFLMADACANSYSRSITIDTLIIPNVATSGSTCAGAVASLSLPSSPFFSYAWQRPNGSTSTGNAVILNPVSASDLGTYTISVTTAVGGCTNTSSKSLTLNACQSLGQTLLHFSGQRKNGNIQLNWQTADEINMSYYIVERSSDGIVFTPVQRVAATGGAQNRYTATDIHVPAGIVYYRLQPVETSGNFSYSSIISFTGANTQPFNVYPSLITGNTPVTVTCPVTNRTSFIRVISVDGKVLQTIAVAAGTTKTSIDVTNLARGSYFVVFTGNDNVVETQVWKE